MLVSGVIALSTSLASATGKETLAFPVDAYQIESKTVRIRDQDHTIRFRHYRHIPYVALPIDNAYQSLDVAVPIEFDGKPVEAGRAPILLDIRVGGYRSVNNLQGDRSDPAREDPGAFPRPENASPESGRPLAKGVAPMRGGNGVKTDLALAAGYVVVTPGVRGWENQAADGRYFGKAPAAIVDLKAAVRYIRHNAGGLPGNPEWIISSGCSAGGGLSALLGTSGNQPGYDTYLKALGAADASDSIFAAACFSPITDLEHADMSYEWMYGAIPGRSGRVDPSVSAKLATANIAYQNSLELRGRAGFGPVSGERLADYVVQIYAQPAATAYLAGLEDPARKAYLVANPWVRWDGTRATFAFADYAAHVGRMKSLPAFDDLTLKAPENRVFGTENLDARHFTDFSLQQSNGNPDARLDPELRRLVALMNPMTYTGKQYTGVARHWWLRNGSHDSNNAESVMINLATALENQGHDVDAALFWDGGHCADEDPQGMIDWIGRITGFKHR